MNKKNDLPPTYLDQDEYTNYELENPLSDAAFYMLCVPVIISALWLAYLVFITLAEWYASCYIWLIR